MEVAVDEPIANLMYVEVATGRDDTSYRTMYFLMRIVAESIPETHQSSQSCFEMP